MHLPYTSVALGNLRPGALWEMVNEDYDTLKWRDKVQSKPTKQEVETEANRLLQEWVNTEYQRSRALEYPSIGDQLDALWKGGDALETMKAQVMAVKAKYPKL
jgi:hypothetical protein